MLTLDRQQPPLFPDLLDRHDNGFGTPRHKVWSLVHCHRRGSPVSELRCVLVIYEDPTWFLPPEPRCWRVIVEHHYYPFELVGRKRVCRHRSRRVQRWFVSRDEAIALAEKLLAAVQRVEEAYQRHDQECES